MAQFGSGLLQVISGKRTKHLALGLILLLLLLMSVSWLALPSYVKRLAIEQTQQQIGRKLEIADINFSPLTLTLTANGVSLFEADQKTPMLKLKSSTLSLSISSLFHGAFVMDEVLLDEPALHVVRTSANGYGHYNFSDILDRVAAMPKSATPFRFSLANVQLQGGKIQFDDLVLDKHIQVDALQMGLPFLSNFPRAINSFVQPALSGKINGAPFALKGRSKPFDASQETSLALDVERLDLSSYIAYLPLALPLKVQSAQLSSKLDLVFSRKNQQPELLLSGDAQIDALSVQDKLARPLLNMRSIKAHIKQFNVLSAAASIDKLHLDTPEVWLSLDQQGRLNWSALLQEEQKAVAEKPSTEKAAKPDPIKPVISLAELLLDHGRLHVSDAWNASPAQTIQLSEISLSAKQLSTAADAKPSSFSLSAQAEQNQGLKFEGQFSPVNADLTGSASLDALRIGDYQAYADRFIAAKLDGLVSLKTRLSMRQGKLKLDELALQLDDVLIQANAKNSGQLAFKSIRLDQLNLDTEARTVKASHLKVAGAKADIWRDAQSNLSLQKLLVPHKAAGPALAPSSAKPVSAAAASGSGKRQSDWLVSLQNFTMSESGFSFSDAAVSPTVKMKAEDIELSAANLSSDLSQAISMKWVSTVNRRGKLTLTADASPHLNKLNGNIDGKSLPVASLYPYFSRFLNVELLSGHANLKGKFSLQNDPAKALVTNYEGMLSLNDFKILEKGESEDFLYWKTINLDGINLSLGGAKQFVFLRKLSLEDFYTKLILSEKGELNISDIVVRKEAGTTMAAQPASAIPLAVSPVVVADQSTSRTKANPLEIRIAQTMLKGGNINFTDNFIKPNYRANLTGVSGSIGAVSSTKPEAAALQLEGKIDDEAPLLISGTVNPLSKPVFVDIKGSANGIQMTRLSPYAAKYAGYPIVKGHLSVQVAYHVENEKLSAENDVRLDQLTFGDKVDSPDATSLPVKLALALLRDNQGNIAVNLPISGSLSDPQFSLGGIIFRVFVNIITKAVTAPFALLGKAFGGGEELAYAEFSPGRSDLSAATITKLEHLVKALKERSSLKLDITGRVDPKTDTEGLRLVSLDNKIKTFKLRDARKKNRAIKAEEVVIEEADRTAYIEEVYSAEKFPKQRNLVGIAKTLPPQEAMALVLSHTSVTEEDLRSLAQRRADIVLDYLEKQGAVGKDRLFLIAPKLHADDLKDKGLPNRVDFSLK